VGTFYTWEHKRFLAFRSYKSLAFLPSLALDKDTTEPSSEEGCCRCWAWGSLQQFCHWHLNWARPGEGAVTLGARGGRKARGLSEGEGEFRCHQSLSNVCVYVRNKDTTSRKTVGGWLPMTTVEHTASSVINGHITRISAVSSLNFNLVHNNAGLFHIC
jgi:hypothetical protein